MSNVQQIIREARGRVMRGAATLQSPGVPLELSQSAAPLTQVAGLLELLESSGQHSVAPTFPLVLSTLQRALHDLQWSSQQHPLRDAAIDDVASALGLVFTMKDAAKAPSAAPAQVAPPVLASVTPPTMREVERAEEPKPQQRAESKGAPKVERASTKPKVSPGSVKPGLVADAVKAAGKAPASAKAKAKTKEPALVEQPPRVPPSRSPASQVGGLPRLDALLGANSASNFYRGFDGDDVVSHGGMFVATYNSPNLGQRIALRVSFPDGHEFTTQGVVKWRRLAAPDGSHPHDVPPGFGVSLEEVSDQARALIARYVSNREPLFHDDD